MPPRGTPTRRSCFEDLGDKIADVEAEDRGGRSAPPRSCEASRSAALSSPTRTKAATTRRVSRPRSPGEGMRSSELLNRVNEATTPRSPSCTRSTRTSSATPTSPRPSATSSDAEQLAGRPAKLDGLLAEAKRRRSRSRSACRETEARGRRGSGGCRRASRPTAGPPKARERRSSTAWSARCRAPPSARLSGSRARRHSHQGTDMIAPMGTPNLAVVGGNVTSVTGGSGGNRRLSRRATTAMTYVYYHLSEYVGGPRLACRRAR